MIDVHNKKHQIVIGLAIFSIIAMFMVVSAINKKNAPPSNLSDGSIQNNQTENKVDSTVIGDNSTMTRKDVTTGDIGGDANIQ